MTKELSIKVPCIVESDGSFRSSTHEVVLETPYSLWLNGRLILTVMTSPSRIEDFVAGYLYTEGIIRAFSDIESIQIEKQAIRVLAKVKPGVRAGNKIILSGCGGDSSYVDPKKLPRIKSDLILSPVWLHQAIRAVLDSELHVRTGGIHVVGLVNSTEIITKTEDIGRHNALDRVIGFALREGCDLSRTCVIISGRISSEMARKCIMANIPVIASRGATTSLAIALAGVTGLTIIGFVRGSKMTIYTRAERVSGTDPDTIHDLKDKERTDSGGDQ